MTESHRQSQESIVRLRSICLDLPEATERETWGHPTFRVREKIFAMYQLEEDRPALWCKAPTGAQDILVHAEPDRYFVPPYVGGNGWIGIWLDSEVDWPEVRDHISESFRLIAPKRLAGQVPA